MHNLLLHVLDLMKRGGALALGVIIGCLIAILILRLITRKKAENFPWKRLAPGALTASMIEVGGSFIDGTVKVLFDGDGNIAKIRNSVSTLTPYRTVKVVSESEAARRLERGDFSYGGAFEYDRPEKVEVGSVRLVGKIDSKGFYRPVYLFNIDGTTTPSVFVSAD